jgi:hypothetical protein
MINKAERKADLAAGRASARRHPVPMLVEEFPLGGFQLWKVGDVLVGMPRLLSNAPARVRRVYRLRLISNATGECSHCGSISDDPADDTDYAPFPHHNDCPVLRTDFERWIDPRARRAA